jgi:hypothetical protein
MEDFFGAGFFLLLLMPVVAAVIGGVGAGLGKAIKGRGNKSSKESTKNESVH